MTFPQVVCKFSVVLRKACISYIKFTIHFPVQGIRYEELGFKIHNAGLTRATNKNA